MCEGFNFKFKREYEMYLYELKLIRWVGSLIYNTNVKKVNQMSPDKLYPLPDIEEKKETKKLPSEEEMKEIRSWIK